MPIAQPNPASANPANWPKGGSFGRGNPPRPTVPAPTTAWAPAGSFGRGQPQSNWLGKAIGAAKAGVAAAPAAVWANGSPWGSSDLISPGGHAQQQASRDQAAAVQMAIQAIEAQQALSDAQYNARRNELLFSQGQAATTRDRQISELQATTNTQLGLLGGDRYRTVDLGLQGVAADRAYWTAISEAFAKETQNLQANQAKQREFLARAFGIETSQLDALLGFAGERKDITNRQLNDQHRFALENRGLSDRRSQLTYDSANRQAWSDATARGAVTSAGFRDTREELLDQLGLSKAGSDLSYREKESDIGTRRLANDLDYRSTVSDIGTRRQTAGLSKDRGEQALVQEWLDRIVENDRSNATISRGWSDANRTEASLSSLAHDFGLRASDLKDRLRRGTAAANMDYAQTVDAINSALASNDETQRAAAMAIAQSLAGV